MLFVIYVLVLFFVPAFAPPPPVTPNAPSNRIWMQGWSTLPPGSSRPPSPQPEVNPSDETQHIPSPVDHLPPASANKLPEVNPSQHKPSDETQHIPPHPVDHLPPASANKLPEVNPSQAKPADPPPSSASGGGSKGNAQSGQVNSSQHKPADHPASAPDDTHQKVNPTRSQKRYLWEEGWTKLPSEVGPSGLQVQSQTADQVHLPASQRNIAGGGHEGIAKPVNPSLPKPADHPARANMVDAPADAHPSHDASHPIHSPTSGLQVQSQTANPAWIGRAPSPQVHLPASQSNSASGGHEGIAMRLKPLTRKQLKQQEKNLKRYAANAARNEADPARKKDYFSIVAWADDPNKPKVHLPVSQHKPAVDHASASSGPQTNSPGHQAHPTQHQTGKK